MAARRTPDAKSKSRFQVCAEEFCDTYFKCSYQCHLQEKPSSSNVRTFIATFSKPTLLTPAPPAVVRVNLEVVYEGGGCKVSRFKGARISGLRACDAFRPLSQSTEAATTWTPKRRSTNSGSTGYVRGAANQMRSTLRRSRRLCASPAGHPEKTCAAANGAPRRLLHRDSFATIVALQSDRQLSDCCGARLFAVSWHSTDT